MEYFLFCVIAHCLLLFSKPTLAWSWWRTPESESSLDWDMEKPKGKRATVPLAGTPQASELVAYNEEMGPSESPELPSNNALLLGLPAFPAGPDRTAYFIPKLATVVSLLCAAMYLSRRKLFPIRLWRTDLNRPWQDITRSLFYTADSPLMSKDRKIAVVTGGNGGIGRAIVEGLLQSCVNVIIACRNVDKAKKTIEELEMERKAEDPSRRVMVVSLDLQDVSSCFQAAEEIRSICRCWKQSENGAVDILFCNAGITLYEKENYSSFLSLWSWSRICHFFSTSRAYPGGPSFIREKVGVLTGGTSSWRTGVNTGGKVSADEAAGGSMEDVGRYGAAFCTHILGHYILFMELIANKKKMMDSPSSSTSSLSSSSEQRSVVVWTGSRSACNSYANRAMLFDDVQGLQCDEPYGYTKYLQDVLSSAINERGRERMEIGQPSWISCVGCPGTVCTELSPPALRTILRPFNSFISHIHAMWTLTPQRGAVVLIRIAAMMLKRPKGTEWNEPQQHPQKQSDSPSKYAQHKKWVMHFDELQLASYGVHLRSAFEEQWLMSQLNECYEKAKKKCGQSGIKE